MMKVSEEVVVTLIGSIQGVLTIVLGIWAFLYTRKQHFLEEQKFKLELYDRRFRVYEEIKSFLSYIMTNGSINVEQLLDLKRQTSEAEFLFDEPINAYINDLYKRGLQFLETERKLSREAQLSAGEDRNRIVDQNCKHLEFFGNQFEESKKNFLKYLKVSNKL